MSFVGGELENWEEYIQLELHTLGLVSQNSNAMTEDKNLAPIYLQELDRCWVGLWKEEGRQQFRKKIEFKNWQKRNSKRNFCPVGLSGPCFKFQIKVTWIFCVDWPPPNMEEQLSFSRKQVKSWSKMRVWIVGTVNINRKFPHFWSISIPMQGTKFK